MTTTSAACSMAVASRSRSLSELFRSVISLALPTSPTTFPVESRKGALEARNTRNPAPVRRVSSTTSGTPDSMMRRSVSASIAPVAESTWISRSVFPITSASVRPTTSSVAGLAKSQRPALSLRNTGSGTESITARRCASLFARARSTVQRSVTSRRTATALSAAPGALGMGEALPESTLQDPSGLRRWSSRSRTGFPSRAARGPGHSAVGMGVTRSGA